ncbi:MULTISPECIES: hypothetical protein [Haloferax]|uniref:Uncharacterized protein n=1 Tax=Haloferax marinisediminis TaxID=2666142 RepID=A0A6G1YZI0_9EURY|nr:MULTISPECIES: hypothetical protein [Haloferax]MRW79807.1 hypothetical protein [Haloferax marinisediminis]
MHRKGALVAGYTICVGGLLLTAQSEMVVALGLVLVALAAGATVLGDGTQNNR